MTSFTIRKANPEDAERLAELAEKTFRETFAQDNTPEDMDQYVREALSTARVRIELSDPSNVFLVALADERFLGYAKLRTSSTEPCVTGPSPIEIERLYVDQSSTGRGLGRALMQACLDIARANHHETVWLGVWEHNHRARRFYERWGFREVGQHIFRLGTDDQIDIILTRPLQAAAPSG